MDILENSDIQVPFKLVLKGGVFKKAGVNFLRTENLVSGPTINVNCLSLADYTHYLCGDDDSVILLPHAVLAIHGLPQGGGGIQTTP